MNLLINATTIASGNLTGIERFALRITQELYRLNKSVEIFTTNEIPGVPLAKVPSLLTFGKRFLKTREYLLRAIWDQTFFRYHVKVTKPDVVFFPIQDGMISPPCKQVVTVHDLHYLFFDNELSECRDEIGRARKSIYKNKLPRILKDSVAIIVVSELTKAELIQKFAIASEKIHVIYNGYDESRFREIDDPRSVLGKYGLQYNKYFLYVGSILRHKNLLRLVQAFSQINCDACLVIVGVCKDKDYLNAIMQSAELLGIPRDKLRYLNYVSDDDLPYLYNGALACVLPSLHEGFGVPLIEAMACGVPVITSDCSAMPEIAGNAARFIDPLNVESIAAGMNDIFTKPQLRSELMVLGIERAKSFQWSISANKLNELFKTIGVQ